MFVVDAAYVIEDAWRKDEQFVDQVVYGTPDYIAPEVILGLPYGNQKNMLHTDCKLYTTYTLLLSLIIHNTSIMYK